MRSGISLANKCQLLFGLAIVVILFCALSVPWVRTGSLVRDTQWEVARQLSDAILNGEIAIDEQNVADAQPQPSDSQAPPPDSQTPAPHPQAQPSDANVAGSKSESTSTGTRADAANEDAEAGADPPSLAISLHEVVEIESVQNAKPFLTAALRRFREKPDQLEHTAVMEVDGRQVYRFARPVRESQLQQIHSGATAGDAAGGRENAPDRPTRREASAAVDDPIAAILVVDRTSPFAEGQLLTSRVFIITAGIIASLLAGLVFYLILTKLILSPVRSLRETTEKVQSGDLRIRSQIKTGDEFEQLSEAFNIMLDRLEQGQAQLRALNESLDLKLMELSEANVGLYESNRFKSEFLANVSHELRTPLNSIIGFAELLEEIARNDADPNPKRLRYIANILTSGRSLLEMINELLDMAKIEAGRMEVTIEPTSAGDLIEGLVGIMRPQAEAKKIELRSVIGQRLPTIETDPGKLQQIIYNFLSNAIKFTPEGGVVTISADRVTRQDNSLGVRLAVSDTGPGIPYDMQDVIFEKFRQIDASHTRQHAGTGLGLAICKELAQMLGATVSFVSEPGRGATFFVDLPLTHQPAAPQPLMA